jgi:hypothetical protein
MVFAKFQLRGGNLTSLWHDGGALRAKIRSAIVGVTPSCSGTFVNDAPS